jgi:hypothetical protein
MLPAKVALARTTALALMDNTLEIAIGFFGFLNLFQRFHQFRHFLTSFLWFYENGVRSI